MPKYTIALLLSAALITSHASAGGDHESKLKQIRSLVELTDIPAITKQIVNVTILQLAQADNQKTDHPIPEKDLKRLSTIASEILGEMMGRPGGLTEFLTSMYDKYYSASDINSLLSFYHSPIGKKTLTVGQQIVTESMGFVQNWMQSISPEFQSQLKERLTKEGISLPGQ